MTEGIGTDRRSYVFGPGLYAAPSMEWPTRRVLILDMAKRIAGAAKQYLRSIGHPMATLANVDPAGTRATRSGWAG
jgi:hypothetical protein